MKNKELIKKYQNIYKKEQKELRRERLRKSGFYLKANFLLSLLVVMSLFVLAHTIAFKERNKPSGYNVPETYLNAPTGQIEPLNETLGLETMARITCFGKTGYKMANGLYPEEGWVATSDRSIPFGTIIEIEGVEYKVGDRTARWVNEQFEYPTIDIYLDNCSLDYGASIKNVIIK